MEQQHEVQASAALTEEISDDRRARWLDALATQAQQSAAIMRHVVGDGPRQEGCVLDWAQVVALTAKSHWVDFESQIRVITWPHELENECGDFLDTLAAINAVALVVNEGSSWTDKDRWEVPQMQLLGPIVALDRRLCDLGRTFVGRYQLPSKTVEGVSHA